MLSIIVMRALTWIVVVVGALGARAARAQTLEMTAPLASVHFRSGSAKLEAGAVSALRAAAAWSRSHPWRLLVIQGYADRVGGRYANLALSQARADAVRHALLELGADPNRIVSAAYGDTEPAATLAASRRVDVRGTRIQLPELIENQRPKLPPSPPPPVTEPGV